MPDQTPHPGATERPGALDEPVMCRWEFGRIPRDAAGVEVATFVGPREAFDAIPDRARWDAREFRPGWVTAVRLIAITS